MCSSLHNRRFRSSLPFSGSFFNRFFLNRRRSVWNEVSNLFQVARVQRAETRPYLFNSSVLLMWLIPFEYFSKALPVCVGLTRASSCPDEGGELFDSVGVDIPRSFFRAYSSILTRLDRSAFTRLKDTFSLSKRPNFALDSCRSISHSFRSRSILRCSRCSQYRIPGSVYPSGSVISDLVSRLE